MFLRFGPVLLSKGEGCRLLTLPDWETLLTVLNGGLVPRPLTLCQLVGSPLVALPVTLPPLTLLQLPLVLLVQGKCSEGEVLLSDLLDPRVRVVDYMDALKLEVENLGEVDVVECVCFVNLIFQRLRRGGGRVVIV